MLGAAISALLATGCTRPSEEEKEGEEIPTVVVAPVEKMSFTETIRGVGACAPLPNSMAAVCSVVDGAVASVLAAEGEEVKAGQALVRLDDRLAVQDLAARKAAKAELEASLVLIKAPPREQDRRSAELEVERAKLAAGLAAAEVGRLEPLRQREEVSVRQLLEAKQRLADATLAAKVAEARHELLLAGARPEAIAEAEAKVASAEAAAAAAAARLGYYSLTSPLAGVVESVHCHPGQLLAPGAPAVEVIDASSLLVTVPVPPAEAGRVKPGQAAKVTERATGSTVAPAGEPLDGKVSSVGLQTDASTGSVPVRVMVQNTAARLRAGMLVQVEIEVGKVDDVLAVPEAAVLVTDEGPAIAVVRADKAVVLHPRTGLRHGGRTQVTVDGLAAGDLVVTRGAYDLEDGAKVKVEEAHEEAHEEGHEKGPEKGHEKQAEKENEKEPGAAHAEGKAAGPEKAEGSKS